jgi:DNA-binding NarL/FixJ family response regulator
LERLLADAQEIQVIGETKSALEATDAIVKQKPDLVLLDIDLFDRNRFDVIKYLKKNSTEFDQVIPALMQIIQQRAGSA